VIYFWFFTIFGVLCLLQALTEVGRRSGLPLLYEERHDGESWLIWKLGNLLTIPQEWIRSIGFARGFKQN